MQSKSLLFNGRILFFFFLIMSSLCCKKTTESIVDCFSESLLVSVHEKTDAGNNKKKLFEVKYIGTHTISNITWEYGDGASETLSTTTSNHTYTVSGTFTVRAKVHLNNGSCTIEPTKTFSIP